MSTFKIPTINKNNLFAPSTIIFLTGSCLYFFSQPLRDKNGYQLYLLIVLMLFSCTVFLYQFYVLENIFKKGKAIYLIFNICTFSLILFLVNAAARDMADNFYPEFYLSNYLFATIIFLAQIGINQSMKLLKMNLVIAYLIGFTCLIYSLKHPSFVNYNDSTYKLYQITGVFLVCVELLRLLVISRRLVDCKK